MGTKLAGKLIVGLIVLAIIGVLRSENKKQIGGSLL